ncbi:MAG: hypothetical protein J2P16_00050 [Mycobacterium sp.]|nr:hypothetical protein [Mycobacterium sp.]
MAGIVNSIQSVLRGGSPSMVAADMLGLEVATRAAVRSAVTTHGMLLQAAVKRNASRSRAEPSVAGLGPRIQTGQYVASIGLALAESRGTYIASVGSNAAQARRLELGFHGRDAAGRNARTEPHPHYAPALEAITPRFEAAMAAIGVPKK